MAVNVTANWRLIRAFDPLLRISDSGRVLMVSSAVARLNRPYWGPYAISKAALELLTFTYAAECNGTNVKANALNPGSDAHPHARRGNARRGPDEFAGAGRIDVRSSSRCCRPPAPRLPNW